MAEGRLPGEARAEALLAIYLKANRELRSIIRAAALRGAKGTTAYFRRQLTAVEAIQRRLRIANGEMVQLVILDAYTITAEAVGEVASLDQFNFGGVHQEQVDVLVRALSNNLEGAVRTVGRASEDALRKAGLEQSALSVALGETRKAGAARLRSKLADQGTTALVDKGGRRWPLDTYSAMVLRTTPREAASVATVERLREAGQDLVAWSSHIGSCPICLPLQGRTYSISGRDERYPRLEVSPPAHPNCAHVLHPAGANFADFERELGVAA